MKKNLENLWRSIGAAPRKSFWLFLALTLSAAPNLQAQFGGVSWGPSTAYDVGYNPSVAASGVSYMVEVHNGQNGSGPMWYHVGQATWSWPAPSPSVAWGPYQEYDSGYNPSIAGCLQSNIVVEVHNAKGSPGQMVYHVGSIQGDTPGNAFVEWGPALPYSLGWNPKIALLCNYSQWTVVEVHNGMFDPTGRSDNPMTMYYQVGMIDSDLKSISWSPPFAYDIGWDPSVAAYGSTVVEVHNNAGGTPGSLWYHVGLLNPNWTIAWGPPTQYDVGWEPKVAIVASNGNDDLAPMGSSPLVIEVHNGQGNFGPMWYHLGQVGNNLNVKFGPAQKYDVGWDPSIAWVEMEYAGGLYAGAVEVHDGQAGFGWMWSHGDLWIPPGGFVVNGN